MILIYNDILNNYSMYLNVLYYIFKIKFFIIFYIIKRYMLRGIGMFYN